MANLIRRWRDPMRALQRDLDDLFEEFTMPRTFRREVERMFAEVPSVRSIFREMDRIMDDFAPPLSLRSRVDNVLEDWLGGRIFTSRERVAALQIPLELTERHGEYVLMADLPGVREEDVDVRLTDGNVLTVSGERRHGESQQYGGYEYTERSYGSFARSVELPLGIDKAKIEADFRHGVLEVHIPKSAEAMPRKVPIGREEPRVLGAGRNGVSVPVGTQVQARA